MTNEFPTICPCYCNDEATKSPTVSPTKSPTRSPTRSPTVSPTVSPTIFPTISPTVSPTTSPSVAPPASTEHCGCEKCTDDVWNADANGYTCGNRISFLKNADQDTLLSVGITTGPFDEAGACQKVTDEFPDICTCVCEEEEEETPIPTESPTISPFACGCSECTEQVWNTNVDGYTCGDRISFVRDSDENTLLSVGITNGPFDEVGACRFVADQYPEVCTCSC